MGREPTCENARGSKGVTTDSAVCAAAMDMDSVRVGLYFEFYQDRFVAVTLVSAPAAYADLKRSLIVRYGAPTRAETKMKVGPLSEHMSEEVLWEGPMVRIKLSQYVGDLTFSVAVIASGGHQPTGRRGHRSEPADPDPKASLGPAVRAIRDVSYRQGDAAYLPLPRRDGSTGRDVPEAPTIHVCPGGLGEGPPAG